MKHRTWPRTSSSSPFSSLPFDSSAGKHARSVRRCFYPPPSPSPPPRPSGGDFSALPYDVMAKIAASFDNPNLQAASAVCRSWREALRPLREAMLLLRWGKKFKHGAPGVRPNAEKALESFEKAAARGSALAMVDAGLVYWERGDKHRALDLFLKSADLGNHAAQCNLGISYLQGVFNFVIFIFNFEFFFHEFRV